MKSEKERERELRNTFSDLFWEKTGYYRWVGSREGIVVNFNHNGREWVCKSLIKLFNDRNNPIGVGDTPANSYRDMMDKKRKIEGEQAMGCLILIGIALVIAFLIWLFQFIASFFI